MNQDTTCNTKACEGIPWVDGYCANCWCRAATAIALRSIVDPRFRKALKK